MTRYLLIFILTIITTKAYSDNYQVYGKLKDASTKQAIEFATIAVNNSSNDSLTTSIITDSKGEFVFDVAPGEYTITIRFLGYKMIKEKINVYDQNIYLKTFMMEIDNNNLDEVNVTASSYTDKFDRSVQTITKEFKQGTNNVSDLLKKIRGVAVDPLDNSVKVDNKENVLLLVNGIKKEQSYIKKLSPERISRIEISRNPTGRYVSEGYSSVINVILKKNYTGYDLYIEDSGLYSLDKSNGDDVLFNNQASVDLTYSIKKVNIYGSLYNAISNTNLPVENIKQLGNESLSMKPVSDSPNSVSDGFTNNFVLGTDLLFTPEHTLSFEASVVQSPKDKNSTMRTYNNIYDSNGVEDAFNSELFNDQSGIQFYSQLAYRLKFSDKNKLELDYNYNISDGEQQNSYTENVGGEINQDLDSKINSSILDLNLNHQFSDTYSLEFGYKNTYRTYNYDYTSLGFDNYSETNKDIRNLAYTYFSFTPVGKIKSKIGLAVEQNVLRTGDQTNHNNSIQPYLSVNYKQSKDLNITLKLNSDSDYPYANQISPYEFTIDRFSSEIGNPTLNYSTRYTSSIDFSLFNSKLSIEPYYSYTNNFISKTGELHDGYFLYTYSNLDKLESFGVNLSTQLAIIPQKMFFNFSASFYNDKTEFNNYTNNIKDYNINSNIMYFYAKHKTLLAVILKKMNSKTIQAYGYSNNDNDYIGCFLQQPFFKGKMAVTLLYLLPVNYGLDYSMDDYFEYDSFKERTTYGVGMLKNLLMVKVAFSLNRGNEINSINKKDYSEKKATKGFF